MGCQTEIAEKIVEKGGDYLLALKGNQTGLKRGVWKRFLEGVQPIQKRNSLRIRIFKRKRSVTIELQKESAILSR